MTQVCMNGSLTDVNTSGCIKSPERLIVPGSAAYYSPHRLCSADVSLKDVEEFLTFW